MDALADMTSSSGPDAAWITSRIQSARDAARRGLDEGRSGLDIVNALTAAVEASIREVLSYHFAQANIGSSSGVAVLATGSFGRRELAPYSDLDLLFLCEKSPDSKIEALARSILLPLWDAKVDAGHAVRSVADGLGLPGKDLAAATALLDARFLVGDERLALDFLAQYQARVAGARPDGLVARLREEQEGRHSRFGDTIFMLEPDLKNGPGGVRDLCVGRWAAQARFHASTPARLEQLGEMSARQAEAWGKAIDFTLRLRLALHLIAGRRQDQLRFDLQERIAPLFHAEGTWADDDSRPAVTPAVEALMHDFQTHARTIARTTERLMQRVCAPPHDRSVTRPVFVSACTPGDPSFVRRKGKLEVKDSLIFEKHPSEMIRIFCVSQDVSFGIGLATLDLISELAASHAQALRDDPQSAKYFLDLLTNVKDTSTPSRLEQMHDHGLISALLPEWGPVSGRVQHDIYHVYTVDQHSLYAVATLKAVARGELRKDYPEVCDAYPDVVRTQALFVGLLLHDVGKPLGSNHAEKGAVMSERIAGRLGLSPEDVGLVEFLVRAHLEMGHNSQRRDLQDPSLLDFFARTCGDEERLRQLFILTFCDLTSTGPKTMTRWKYELLYELFDRTLKYMRRGPDLLAAERAELVEERQRQAAALLDEDSHSASAVVAFTGLPDRYFAEQEADKIAEHVRLMRGRNSPCALAVTHSERGTFSELVLVADDVPGLLAKVAGVLHANRIDILDAAIYSRDPVFPLRKQGEALDVFRIRKEPDGAVTDPNRIEAIRRDLEEVLSGRVTVESLVAKRVPPSSLYQRAKPKVPSTQVNVDNDSSRTFTVVEVFTEDKPGVLYTITHTLAEQGLDIHRSRVGVAADRVADIFYVRDTASGDKIEDDERIEAISDALKLALKAS
ncbi:MAG TPA: [protein-PII] uridylyltransferase [Polyangia bacterium]